VKVQTEALKSENCVSTGKGCETTGPLGQENRVKLPENPELGDNGSVTVTVETPSTQVRVAETRGPERIRTRRILL
jgi:hypothetical protein